MLTEYFTSSIVLGYAGGFLKMIRRDGVDEGEALQTLEKVRGLLALIVGSNIKRFSDKGGAEYEVLYCDEKREYEVLKFDGEICLSYRFQEDGVPIGFFKSEGDFRPMRRMEKESNIKPFRKSKEFKWVWFSKHDEAVEEVYLLISGMGESLSEGCEILE